MLWVISLVSRDKEGLNQRLETSIQAYSPPRWKDIEHNRSRTPPEHPLIDKITLKSASYPTKLIIQGISWDYYCEKFHFWKCNSAVENQFRTKNCILSNFNSLPDAFYRIIDELVRGVLYTPHVMKSGIELTYPPEYCLCYFPTIIKNLKNILKSGNLTKKWLFPKWK